jgi:hypothetical protein
MIRASLALGVLLLPCAFAQFKSYKTQEDYCRDNPKAPTCIKTGPMDLSSITNPGYHNPNAKSSPSRATKPRPTPQAMPALVNLPPQTGLQDWRFSHTSPAMLMNINITSLAASPLWNNIAPSLGLTPGDLGNVRAALTGVGQLLVSIVPNGRLAPSVLTLAKGQIDGALGDWLKSGGGSQALRLDPITLLVGDPNALAFAKMRLRNADARASSTLQATATEEAMKYDLWVGLDPRQLASMASVFGTPSTNALNAFAQLRGISLGFYLRDQIRIEALVEAPSPEIAERMLAAYENAPQQETGQIWTSVEGTRLRYIEIVDPAKLSNSPMFDDAISKTMLVKLAPLFQSLARQSPSKAPVAPRPSTGAIVIQGLN